MAGSAPPSGHAFRVERTRVPSWYMKYRPPDGRQVQKKLDPAWTGRGRPAAGHFTKRLAEERLREVLLEASRGTLTNQPRTSVSFAEAASEFCYVEEDRERKPSTLAGYRAIVRSQLLPAFGELPLDAMTTPMIEQWLASLGRTPVTRRLALVLLHGDLPPRDEGLGAADQSGGRRREAPAHAQRRPGGVLTRGGKGARSRRRVQAGCRHSI